LWFYFGSFSVLANGRLTNRECRAALASVNAMVLEGVVRLLPEVFLELSLLDAFLASQPSYRG
jgi:hypothetical protein